MQTMQTTHYHFNTPCSIALVADTHNTPCDHVIASLRENRPDIICIPGDIFYGGVDAALPNQHNVLPLLDACVSIAPTFLSLGNHDWALTAADLDLLRARGVRVLDNEWTRHEGLVIGGLTSGITLHLRQSEWNSQTRSYPPITDWLSDFAAQDGYRILLCHHPEYSAFLCKPWRSIDLILSGHAHGGQWRLFGRGIFAPGQGLFPALTSGVHGNHIISRGLANTTRFPRFNNPTEIVYISPDL